MELKVLKIHPNARAPEQAKLPDATGDPRVVPSWWWDPAAYDLYTYDYGTIPAGGRKIISLGFAAEFTPGYVGLVCDRGGMGANGLTKFGGVIDSDYRGEWMVTIYNSDSKSFDFSPAKAIAQVLFFKVEKPNVLIVTELSETGRGSGRFGSTNRVIDASVGFNSKAGSSGA